MANGDGGGFVGLSESKRQGVTCGDNDRVFAVALCSGAKEDGACR